jgi:hypothetical protein
MPHSLSAAVPSAALMRDGGISWRSQTNGTSNPLHGVACPRPSTCMAVGDFDTIVRSTDGGHTWCSQTNAATDELDGVACARASTCVAVGDRGMILRSTDGGRTWRSQPSGTWEWGRCDCGHRSWPVVTGDQEQVRVGGMPGIRQDRPASAIGRAHAHTPGPSHGPATALHFHGRSRRAYGPNRYPAYSNG